MKNKLLTFFFFISIGLAIGQSKKVENSTVKFTIKNAGISVDGTIGGLKATIKWDANDLKSSEIIASADPSSIDTGIGMRDKHLKKEDYFDVERFPKIEIKSKSFRQLKTGEFEGIFTLTLKGVSKDLTIPFTVEKSNAGLLFKAIFEIDRLDFGVGDSSFILSDIVKISAELIY